MASYLAKDVASIRQQLQQLQQRLQDDDGSVLVIQQFGTTYKLLTKSIYYPILSKYWQSERATNLSQAALEVLAIVAYQQPITRIEIDELRGVKNSSATLQTLMMRHLIKTVGHKEVPGRPLMYKTTDFFLDYFGLKSLDDLTPLADFQQQNLDRQGNIDLFS
ncbi:SMC-Scp complex subunit ScpB [Bombilactobacillus folatiphilus]|uniref:SMC-Scp complex subunit ScpB n=2 Tax=Bombilactobacillus folatiphilus TaxID=2923362 RepID=A0ABY4PC94_9LACO|nr:SMC-Scp complex subunit ScpB [Bombilactobacillus folatiphilus]UQS82887.1 SMC-Scp complex subunit ScpB [Bombilactobacillus folatiphilus]